jgi:acyl carrier protein
MISTETGFADPVALRQELKLEDPVDISSSAFLRFVIRLSERLDLDIPREDYAQLATVPGCRKYLNRK